MVGGPDEQFWLLSGAVGRCCTCGAEQRHAAGRLPSLPHAQNNLGGSTKLPTLNVNLQAPLKGSAARAVAKRAGSFILLWAKPLLTGDEQAAVHKADLPGIILRAVITSQLLGEVLVRAEHCAQCCWLACPLLSPTAASPLLSLRTELTPALCTHRAHMHGCFQTPPVHAGFPLQLMFALSPSLQLCLHSKRTQPRAAQLGDSSALHTEELQICVAVKPRVWLLRLIVLEMPEIISVQTHGAKSPPG